MHCKCLLAMLSTCGFIYKIIVDIVVVVVVVVVVAVITILPKPNNGQFLGNHVNSI